MSDLDRQTSGIHAPEEPEEARELRTSNLVARLRDCLQNDAQELDGLCHEAADEIERMTASLKEAREPFPDLWTEIERLRAALETAKGLLRELDETDYEPSLDVIDRVEALIDSPADETTGEQHGT